MRLLRCHIDQFGKLSNLDIEFEANIHVIHEQNAWGKSTLAAFIKAMLYGLENRKEPGTFEKERKRYRPWQGGAFGGQLEIETGGRHYRICRTFGQTEKSDEFHLFDCATNLESTDFSEKIGEELFELDAISFKRSIYIAQNDCSSRTSDAINAKLGNLVEHTNDINHYEKAQELLKNLANQLTPNRSTGSVKRRTTQIAQLEQEIRSLSSADHLIEDLNQKKNEAIAQREELAGQRAQCLQDMKLAGEAGQRQEIQKHYRMLLAEKEELSAALALMAQSFPNGIPQEEQVSQQLELARSLKEEAAGYKRYALTAEEEESLARLQERFGDFCPTDAMVEEVLREHGHLPRLREDRVRLQARLDEQEKHFLQQQDYEAEAKSLAQAGRGSVIAGAVLLVLGICAAVAVCLTGGMEAGWWNREMRILVMGIGAVTALAGAGLLLTGIITNRKGRKKSRALLQNASEAKERQEEAVHRLQVQEEEKHAQIRQIQERMRSLLEKCHIHCTEENLIARLYELKGQVEVYHRLKKQQEAYRNIRQQYEQDRKQFWSQMRKWSDDTNPEIFEQVEGLSEEDALEVATHLQQISGEYRMAEKNVVFAQRRIEAFLAQNPDGKLEQDAAVESEDAAAELEEINRQIARLDEAIEQTRAVIEQCNRQLEDAKEQLDIRDEKRQELRELQILQEDEKKKFEIVSMTQEYLKNAKEQLTARYMKPISESFEKYYRMLLGEDAGDWQIDANVSFMTKEQGQLRQVQQLSAGYQDLIGVCMRLAMVDAMYPDEKPMLILDDPFVNLDEEKTVRGMELLRKVSEEYQMIYFTCHASRMP